MKEKLKAKFKVGCLVKWNDGKHYNNDKRIDKITYVVEDVFGSTRYYTLETNPEEGSTPKRELAYEQYLVLA